MVLLGDVYYNRELAQRMRDSISKMCGEIDEAADILEKEGMFAKKDD